MNTDVSLTLESPITDLPLEISCEIAKYLDRPSCEIFALLNSKHYELSRKIPFIQNIFLEKRLSKSKVIELSEGKRWKQKALAVKANLCKRFQAEPLNSCVRQPYQTIKSAIFYNCDDKSAVRIYVNFIGLIVIATSGGNLFRSFQRDLEIDSCYKNGLLSCPIEILTVDYAYVIYNLAKAAFISIAAGLLALVTLHIINDAVFDLEQTAEKSGQLYGRVKYLIYKK